MKSVRSSRCAISEADTDSWYRRSKWFCKGGKKELKESKNEWGNNEIKDTMG